jgi:hypothetical protein
MVLLVGKLVRSLHCAPMTRETNICRLVKCVVERITKFLKFSLVARHGEG